MKGYKDPTLQQQLDYQRERNEVLSSELAKREAEVHRLETALRELLKQAVVLAYKEGERTR